MNYQWRAEGGAGARGKEEPDRCYVELQLGSRQEGGGTEEGNRRRAGAEPETAVLIRETIRSNAPNHHGRKKGHCKHAAPTVTYDHCLARGTAAG
jgi:hypothetical protein